MNATGRNRLPILLLAAALAMTACDSAATEAVTAPSSSSSTATTAVATSQAPTSTRGRTTTTTAPEQIIELPSGEWLRTNPDLGGLIVDTRDMIWDGENFYILTRIGFGDVIVWQSSDGIEWTEHSQIGTAGTLDGPQELTSVSGQLIAAGWRGTTAMVWVDEGEQGWVEVEVGSGTIDELVFFNGNYIALGRPFFHPEPGQTRTDIPVIWSSWDGYTWTRTTRAESFAAVGDFAVGLVEGPAGLLTFIFIYGDPQGDPESVVWAVATSEDGINWVADQPSGLEMDYVDAIAGSDTTYFVFGHGSRSTLVSSDGVHWDALTNPDGSDSERVVRQSLATFGDYIVLSGAVFSPVPGDIESYPRVWAYRGGGLWGVLGTGDWYSEPGYAFEMVSGNGRLVVRAITGPGVHDWGIYTFVPDTSD